MLQSDLLQLYRTYGGAIFARCLRILRDRAAAEDAAQETFLRVYRHLDSAPDASEALAWIYRIATNYCLNELRRRKNHRGFEAKLADLRIGAFSEDRIADADLVARLVQRAPEHLGAAAWLYHVDGMDQSEVAQVLGVSRRSVVNYLDAFHRFGRKYISRTDLAVLYPTVHSPAVS